MSKNVAVFVDVANIFYAAKAGGVDIDYVTLLKSAVAGRDFVRAYAYTGLDPENENQRQFHAFLARSGYKVVSKDIRKYGDGRIKANLDIELVVDLMRLARNLDIAVVVSGDGDFAPAIRAVQEMGVRVEVISFRGNTSSDLIEVADQFTDIAQVARVEKSSARSGRRVAAEGDLSMTAVPEKETEGAPRRRRGRTGAAERVATVVEPVAAIEDAGMTGNLIVLPGERLSRAPEDEEVGEEAPVADGAGPGDAMSAEGEAERRRRRRRGGRGRGRGRREEGGRIDEPAGVTGGPTVDDEDEDFEEVVPAQPPHHAFGSVWDSQLGVPSSGLPAASAGGYVADEDEEDYDEPEVPEYLLAERRQRQRGAGGRGGRVQRGGRQGSYQAAIERERYGRTAGGFGATRMADRPDRPRPERRRPGGPAQRPPRQDRPPMDRRPGPDQRMAPPASGDPWTEVPEELEELLRAELARKASAPAGQSGGQPTSGDEVEPGTGAEPETGGEPTAKPKRATRSRTSRATAEPPSAADAAAGEGEAAEAKPKRTTRTTRTTRTRAAAPKAAGEPAETPKRTTRARAKQADDAATAETGEQAAKPARRRRTKAGEGSAEG